MSLRIKICGLRRPEDVDAAVAAGADALGFNFHPQSPRCVSPVEAAALVARVPPGVLPVGVFVHATLEEVRRVMEQTGIRAVQLHGDQDPGPYAALAVERTQVIRLRPSVTLPAAVSPQADWVMLDAWTEKFGGEGRRFDWTLAAGARARYGRPLMVAGGITPENVGELLSLARPDGVDVASGVESSPGVKDPARVRALVQAIRAFERTEEQSA